MQTLPKTRYKDCCHEWPGTAERYRRFSKGCVLHKRRFHLAGRGRGATLAVSAAFAAAALYAQQDAAIMNAKPDIPSRESRKYTEPAEPIRTEPGREFTIKMASNPTTGYKWELAKPPDERIARLVTNVFIPPETSRLGAGGLEAWTFRAAGPGRTGIVFQYIRPWEKDKPACTNAFTVIVREPRAAGTPD